MNLTVISKPSRKAIRSLRRLSSQWKSLEWHQKSVVSGSSYSPKRDSSKHRTLRLDSSDRMLSTQWMLIAKKRQPKKEAWHLLPISWASVQIWWLSSHPQTIEDERGMMLNRKRLEEANLTAASIIYVYLLCWIIRFALQILRSE